MRTEKPFLLGIFLAFFQLAHAQISIPGIPYSLDNQLFTRGVPIVEMPEIDVEAIEAEDELLDQQPEIPYRFGIEHTVDLNMSNSGKWIDLPNGSRLWRLAIRAPEALSINLVYDDFFLPTGSQFFLHNGDYEQILGAFTARNNKTDRGFGTALTYGEISYLEYYEPRQVAGQGRISINTVVHGYRSALKSNYQLGDAGGCNIDTQCSQGDNWQNEARAVGKTIAGGVLCSGTLVGNTTGDKRPLFLTANHCGFSSTVIIYWLFERPGCNSGKPDDTKTTNGATLRSSVDGNPGGGIRGADHLLVELKENPADFYDVFFAGWDASGATAQGVTGIHHPQGDAKKIAIENDPVTSTDYLSNTVNPNQTHWRVADWDHGTMESGSSGSPIFDNTTQHLIGILSGGFATCGNNDDDWYGKFSYAWLNDGATDPLLRLKDWLDPDSTGVLAMDGYGIGDDDFSLTSLFATGINCQEESTTSSVSYPIRIQSPRGSMDTVTLSVSGVPSGASVSFSNNSVVPNTTSTLTIGNLNAVASGNYVLMVEGTSINNSESLLLNLEVVNNCVVACNSINSTDVPLNTIPNTIIESDIMVSDTGVITDVNVYFEGTHERTRDLTFKLRSPTGTIVQLINVNDPCNGVQENFDFGFDDESNLSAVPCPPTTQLLYQPEQPLSIFDGEAANGVWTLLVTDVRVEREGQLTGWRLDYCIHLPPAGCLPNLTISDEPIEAGIYQVEDTITTNGTVASSVIVTFEAGQSINLLPGFVAEYGSTFTAQIQACSPNSLAPIEERHVAMMNVEAKNAVKVYPNPFHTQTTVEVELIEESNVQVELYSLTGKRVSVISPNSKKPLGIHQFQIDAAHLESGMYVLMIRINEEMQAYKLSLVK
jgi:subtilisin-like proprotein convertase family protein